MNDNDLDAIEAQAQHWDHLVRDDPDTTLALVAEVRRLWAENALTNDTLRARTEALHRVTTELDTLRATRARVEGVLRDWRRPSGDYGCDECEVWEEVSAALQGPADE